MKYLLLPIALGLTLASCNQQPETEDPEPFFSVTETEAPQEETTPIVCTEKPEEHPVARKNAASRPALRSDSLPTTLKKAPTRTKPTVAPAKPKSKAETIYVETEGAQGRVWGHVTMKGDRGTGTIHDWDENTLSVTVTRHGDELFAIDQNSRQYVFKLKK